MMAHAKDATAASPSKSNEALRLDVQSLLRLDPCHPGRLVSRENSRLEYKETFNWGSRAKYAKTMAAFANNDGGFIVFGVKNSPHALVGIDVDRFDAFDPEKAAAYLNSAFAPEIPWEVFRIEVAGAQLGVFAVSPVTARPVVCLKTDGQELREADIYYRYRGRSERIRYPELQALLTERQERERDAWLRHLARVARIGVENVGVLDLVDGELSGPGGRLLVSSELLEKVQFIRQGHFTERAGEGAPTLRLIGDVEAVAPGALGPVRTVAQPFAIGEKELLLGFLRQEHPAAPGEYIKQASRSSSMYMPVYHFARAAGLGLKSTREFVARESARGNRLLNRIDGATVSPVGSLSSRSPCAAERQRILEKLEAGDIEGIRNANRVRLFEAITHFEPTAAPASLLALLAEIVGTEFPALSSAERSNGRKAIAHLDEVLNRAGCMRRDAQSMATQTGFIQEEAA